jgi:hypothetical protein
MFTITTAYLNPKETKIKSKLRTVVHIGSNSHVWQLKKTSGNCEYQGQWEAAEEIGEEEKEDPQVC